MGNHRNPNGEPFCLLKQFDRVRETHVYFDDAVRGFEELNEVPPRLLATRPFDPFE